MDISRSRTKTELCPMSEPLNIKRKYKVFYTIEDFDDVKMRVIETDDIEEWVKYFEGQEVDKTVDYYELLYPLNEA